MTRRYRRARPSRLRLYGAERVLFVIGSATYLIGLLGGIGLLGMSGGTVILLLGVGGGMLFAVGLSIVF